MANRQNAKKKKNIVQIEIEKMWMRHTVSQQFCKKYPESSLSWYKRSDFWIWTITNSYRNMYNTLDTLDSNILLLLWMKCDSAIGVDMYWQRQLLRKKPIYTQSNWSFVCITLDNGVCHTIIYRKSWQSIRRTIAQDWYIIILFTCQMNIRFFLLQNSHAQYRRIKHIHIMRNPFFFFESADTIENPMFMNCQIE